MDHAEGFRDITFIVHFLVVINQMTAQIIIVMNFIYLLNLICVLEFFHSVDQSRFTHRKVIFLVSILITILTLTRRTLVHLGLLVPVEV